VLGGGWAPRNWKDRFTNSETLFLTFYGYRPVGGVVDGRFRLLIKVVVSGCLLRDVLLGWLLGDMAIEGVRVYVEGCVPCT